MKLSSFLAQKCSVVVEFGDERLSLVYRPGKYTPKFEADIREATKWEDVDRASLMLHELIDSWDLTDDDGVPIPTNVETLHTLPFEILSECLVAIIRDLRPNRKTSNDTDNG